MPSSRNSCVLCGGPIEDDDKGPPWIGQFRALYSRSRLSTEAYLSGVGRRVLRRDMIPPGPVPDGHPVPDDGLLSIWLMRSIFKEPHPQLREQDAWGFPFHSSCWDLLALVRPDDYVDIQALFDILRSFPVQDGFINFGHTYGGDAKYQWHPGTGAIGKELLLVQGSTPEHQTCDPLELPELRRFIEEASHNPDPSHDEESHAPHPVTGLDPFSKLPPEVLQYILEYLPTIDVLHLKLSSQASANVPMSQSFWISRFMPGREFEAAFEARLNMASLKGRWHSLYGLVKSLRRNKPFTNRERVWGLACSLRAILDQVTSTSLHGDIENLDSLRWVDALTALKHDKTFFSDGSRPFYHRNLCVPPGAAQLLVSLVETYGRQYVSAIRFAPADGTPSVLGYPHAAREVPISVAGASGIAGFHLAQDERGFRGLAVLSTSGALSKWAGDPSGVPVRKLVFDPTERGTLQYLKCAFDAFKVVSLSISNGGLADLAPDHAPSLVDTSLWFPFIPGADLSLLGIDGRGHWYYEAQAPITLVMLDDALRNLESISSIAVRIGVDGEKFGMEVCFLPGTAPLRLGLDGVGTGEVVSFALDYANGEHIRGIESFYERESEFLGFKVHTNKGRTGEFSFHALDEMPRDGVHVESLFPENGTMILGFCSRVNPMWGLSDLGLVCRAKTSSG